MSTATEPLKAPFPYPGGKSRVADLVWSRLGNVDNFVEPFAGSLAVLLRRPADHFAGGYRVETVNDANHYLVNFWRAVKHAPGRVAEWADWPVTEADLHARHRWLVRSAEATAWRGRFTADPEFFDPKVAGWWAWGACCWIGGAWCHDGTAHKKQIPGGNQDGGGYGLNRATDHKRKLPNLGQPCETGGVGVNGTGGRDGLTRFENQRPALHDGSGVHAGGRPQLADAFDIGRGVCGGGNVCDERRRPNFAEGNGYPAHGIGVLANSTAGTCDARRAWLVAWMRSLADRLRLVRTCYGHWSRVCDSDSTLTRLGRTGVFLDPPYPTHRSDTRKRSRSGGLYATDKASDLDQLRDEVLAWCRTWGGDPRIRVAVCGYEGDGYEPLVAEGWSEHAWEASGGYGNQSKRGRGKAENAKRERIWFSPACLADTPEPSLFDYATGA